MNIGIDLDNTVISYDDAFLYVAKKLGVIDRNFQGNKNEIKKLIRGQDQGEVIWQKIQGQVYGKFIYKAKIFEGFKRFLWRCCYQKIPVSVISHKTEYGHHDQEKISLRESALSFLKDQGILIKDKNIFLNRILFTSTREEKIEKIKINNFDWFIDDLPEVIANKKLNGLPNRILFSQSPIKENKEIISCSSWDQIENKILGPLTGSEIQDIASNILEQDILSCDWVGGRGNSGVYKITFPNKKIVALKIYNRNKEHSRIFSEYNGSTKLIEMGVNQIPKPLICDENFNFATYKWIEGKHIQSPTRHHLDQALEFLNQLHSIRHMKTFRSFPRASASCFSGLDIELQLKKRIKKLREVNGIREDIKLYMHNELEPFINEAIAWSKEKWCTFDNFERELSFQDLTLSPSDFGFHNALEKKDGKIIFHDFEYFGWDDPVKLMVDFSLHPGMNLDHQLLRVWFKKSTEIYGKKLVPKLLAAWPLYALCWTLIFLNEFLPEVWSRRILANPSKIDIREAILEKQFLSSRKLLNIIKNNYKKNPLIGASLTNA